MIFPTSFDGTRIAGYSEAQDFLSTEQVNSEQAHHIDYIDDPLIDAVTAATDGDTIGDCLGILYHVFQVIVAGSPGTGAHVTVEGSMDNTNWLQLATTGLITASTYIALDPDSDGRAWRYLRPRVITYTDGTFTVLYRGQR